MSDPIDERQWVQPLFMIYDVETDMLVPLTQERFDQLKAVERQYGMLISDIKRSHIGFVESIGGTPQPWTKK